jgi:NAD(P)-dependent dehydrogenase (short-subunit alcohol dehydrogenase family)
MGNPIDYAFTKGGMINLTRYLASYLGPYNIRVNCPCRAASKRRKWLHRLS